VAKSKHASTRPSDAEKGGGAFGFPPGSVVTITEAAWAEAQEAGEKFVSQGDPEDPVLKLVGEIEGVEEDRPPVYLRAGKAKRGLSPSKDGEFLDIAEGSTATAISEGCNADVFLKSISDKSVHKSKAVPEELHDDGISAVLVGLKFVAGAIVVKREGLTNVRPTLIAEEIVELPKAARKGKAKDEDEDERPAKRSRSAASDKDKDEEEEEPKPKARGKKSSGDESEKKVEQVVVDALEGGKYKKGLPLEKLWTIVYNAVRSDDDKKDCMALVEDEDWVSGDRPWKVSGKGDAAVLLPV
jgi:hypothetical protein